MVPHSKAAEQSIPICRNGHPLTNVYTNPKTGVHACRFCQRDRAREIYQRDYRLGAGAEARRDDRARVD